MCSMLLKTERKQNMAVSSIKFSINGALAQVWVVRFRAPAEYMSKCPWESGSACAAVHLRFLQINSIKCFIHGSMSAEWLASQQEGSIPGSDVLC